MILCTDDCFPCCDFCIHVEHEYINRGEIKIKSAPINCNLHNDIEHKEIADADGYCKDFICFNARGSNFLVKDV